MDSKMTERSSSFAELEKYYSNYGAYTRDLTKKDRKAMGYLCALTPIELISAAGFIPLRITGNIHEPITKADSEMETIVCSVVRCCYDRTIRDYFSFISGLVVPHACDSICKTYDTWNSTLNLPYSHFVNMPHKTDDSSMEFFRNILKTFRKSLEKYTGKEITDSDLLNAIKLHNKYRSILRELAKLKKEDPPLITGDEFTRVLVAGMSIPVEEAVELTSGVISEFKQRGKAVEKKPRLMIVGAQVDDSSFIKLVEEAGSYVVADDLCPGEREFMSDVDESGGLINGIAERYLRKIRCSRTNREMGENYAAYLEDRFGHIGRSIKEYNVDGVILYFYKYCDPFGFDVPAMKSYIESRGVPVLYLEDEYNMSAAARLLTRVQVFLEMITSSK